MLNVKTWSFGNSCKKQDIGILFLANAMICDCVRPAQPVQFRVPAVRIKCTGFAFPYPLKSHGRFTGGSRSPRSAPHTSVPPKSQPSLRQRATQFATGSRRSSRKSPPPNKFRFPIARVFHIVSKCLKDVDAIDRRSLPPLHRNTRMASGNHISQQISTPTLPKSKSNTGRSPPQS